MLSPKRYINYIQYVHEGCQLLFVTLNYLHLAESGQYWITVETQVDNICQCIAAGGSLQNKTIISKQDGNL